MTGICNWCNTLTNSIVKVYDHGYFVWVGCPDCYEKKKRNELEYGTIKN